MKNITPYRILMSLVVSSLLMLAIPATAKELPDGFDVNKSNFDQVKNDTFMGHTIASLLTDHQVWQVRNTGLKFKLAHQAEPVIDPLYWAATKKYTGQAKFDPKTREVTGYMAGMPFPNIDPSDPYAGDKVLWNFYFGIPWGRDVHFNYNFVTVNRNGFESSQIWSYQRIYNRGRLGEASPIIATGKDQDIFSKSLFVAVWPQDVKGIGQYAVRYDSKDMAKNRVEESFAYIKSARRIRRLTGAAWMDPVGGFDLLYDDVNVWNSRPSWYKGAKLLGKRWILAAVEGRTIRNAGSAGTPEEFPQMNFKEKMGWNINVATTPREVWIVEATAPAEHPYSKKVVYVDTKVPAIYLGEFYDKKGNLWRADSFYYHQVIGKTTGIKYFATYCGNFVDFKAMHGTAFMIWGPTGGPESDNGDKWSDWTIERLNRAQ